MNEREKSDSLNRNTASDELSHSCNPRRPVEVVFEQGNCRSAAYLDEEQIGECEFLVKGNEWTIVHTGVRPEFGGQGIAKRLVECVIKAARMEGAKIRPLCSYAERMMMGKDEYRDVL
jgi:predicted GNAT family acetyltransferase